MLQSYVLSINLRSPCIRKHTLTHSQEKQKYTILLIITDGMINDMEATKVYILCCIGTYICQRTFVRLLPPRHGISERSVRAAASNKTHISA
jgi:hypothetical protein